jgi:hypothetical protein
MVFIRSRHSGENRNPVLDMVPDFRRDDAWMPDRVRHDGKRCLWIDSIYPLSPRNGKCSEEKDLTLEENGSIIDPKWLQNDFVSIKTLQGG